MTAKAATLADFLLARIAEDEAAAKAVLDFYYSEGRWEWNTTGLGPVKVALIDERGVHMVQAKGDGPTWMVSDHIARHDPARVLAECEAKRRIVERVSGVEVGYPSHYLAQGVLALLAQPYASHPGFREEWRA